MPSTMTEALLERGLIKPEEALKQLRSERAKIERHLGEIAGSVKVSVDGLGICRSVGEFRDAARKLLLEDSQLIGKVIQAAHVHKDDPGGKELIWLLYQVRDGLKSHSGDKVQLINRALRGAHRTVESVK